MKNVVTLLVLAFLAFSTSSYAAVAVDHWTDAVKGQPEVEAFATELGDMDLDAFLSLTPKQYKEMTGEKLGFKKAMELKAAQKVVKSTLKQAPGIDKTIYIVLAIIGLSWLGVGLASDWDGSDWIVNLVLWLLCGLPGLIHALVIMKKFY
jgi:uncharacterized membrane protein YqaE (UPF0057 family)